MIPESFIQDLLDRADIVDIVGQYVPLRKRGINWFGLCPFHHEKTGSFSVNREKQFFKCFGCGAHGNVIGFIMQVKGLGYVEAIRDLADAMGLEVPEEKSTRERRKKTESLSEVMKQAADYYARELKGCGAAMDYLRERQVSAETRERFGLGYSPDRWQSLEAVFGDSYGSPRLEECGLVIVKESRRYDRFRGRLMFPIRNTQGRVVGFGARIMGEGEPKYLNSPETAIFNKGQELYGLWEGREHMRKAGRAIVCEGYMDVIQLSQAGFRESVAALGTAIGEAHIRKLLKVVPLLYFSFDGDAAGRHAARRALEQALPVISDGQEARFILLPPEHDPDSLIKAGGPDAYRREMANALDLSAFLVESLSEGKNLGSGEGRAKFLTEASPLLQSMRNAPILRHQIISGLQLLLRMDVPAMYGLLRIAPPSTSVPARTARPVQGGAFSVRSLRKKVLQLFIAWPDLIEEFSADVAEYCLGGDAPEDPMIVEIWRAASEALEDGVGDGLTSSQLLERLRESEWSDDYETLLDNEMLVQTPRGTARNEIKVAMLSIAAERLREKINGLFGSAEFDESAYRRLRGLQDWTMGELLRIRQTPSGEA